MPYRTSRQELDMQAMTKTDARKVAKRARQYGYFAPQGGQPFHPIYVFCPLCREQVWAERDWRNGETVIRALDRVMVEHVTTQWDDERCAGKR
jgi:hypothetical protein